MTNGKPNYIEWINAKNIDGKLVGKMDPKDIINVLKNPNINCYEWRSIIDLCQHLLMDKSIQESTEMLILRDVLPKSLIDTIFDEHELENVRIRAAKALGELGNKEMIKQLCEELKICKNKNKDTGSLLNPFGSAIIHAISTIVKRESLTEGEGEILKKMFTNDLFKIVPDDLKLNIYHIYEKIGTFEEVISLAIDMLIEFETKKDLFAATIGNLRIYLSLKDKDVLTNFNTNLLPTMLKEKIGRRDNNFYRVLSYITSQNLLEKDSVFHDRNFRGEKLVSFCSQKTEQRRTNCVKR